MFEWQSHPNTRAFARNPKAPALADHGSWLTATLDDPSRMLTIIMHGADAAGVLRVDAPNERRRREVSIYLAPDRYRRGIGRAALNQLRRLLPDITFEAGINTDNEASIRL